MMEHRHDGTSAWWNTDMGNIDKMEHRMEYRHDGTQTGWNTDRVEHRHGGTQGVTQTRRNTGWNSGWNTNQGGAHGGTQTQCSEDVEGSEAVEVKHSSTVCGGVRSQRCPGVCQTGWCRCLAVRGQTANQCFVPSLPSACCPPIPPPLPPSPSPSLCNKFMLRETLACHQRSGYNGTDTQARAALFLSYTYRNR